MKAKKVFEGGSWGAQFYEGLEPQVSNGDVVVSKHWNSRLVLCFGRDEPRLILLALRSSFQNTDHDFQL